jgi:AraC-like DNA-binding protein
MIAWSTDALRPHERFDYWREIRGRLLGGVTMDLEPDRRAGFAGRFSSQPVGSALLSEIRSSAYDVTRTRADIERVSSDSLRITHLIEGPGWSETRKGTAYLGVDGISTSHSDLPFAVTQRPGAMMHVRLLRIPLPRDGSLARAARNYHTEPLPPDSRYSRLVRATFLSLVDDGPGLAAGEAEAAVRHLARLVMLTRGSARAGEPDSRAAVRDACLKAARRMIATHLHRPDLGVALLARNLGISVRQMHVVFEPTGTTCHGTIQAMRLAEARRLLSAAPGQSVADIAFACGFDCLSTFYRAFRRAEGTTPSDYRAALLEGREAA